MSGYAKLFPSILASTVWQTPYATRITWIALLAMKDRDGVVETSVPGLAKMAGVTLDECEAALECFLSPDRYSKTSDHEGRRIEVVKGGWRLLNADVYRDKQSIEERREKDAVRQQRKRDRAASRDKSQGVTPSHAESVTNDANAVTRPSASVESRHTDPDTDPNADTYSERASADACVSPDVDPGAEPAAAALTPYQLQASARAVGLDRPVTARLGLMREIALRYAPRYRELVGHHWIAPSAIEAIGNGHPQLPHRGISQHLESIAEWAEDQRGPLDLIDRVLAHAFADPWMAANKCPLGRIASEPGRYVDAPKVKRAETIIAAINTKHVREADAEHAAKMARDRAEMLEEPPDMTSLLRGVGRAMP